MAKRTPVRRSISSSERVGDSKRSKRGVEATDVSFDDRRHLYHGVCPDVSNRYRKVAGGRIGEGTYGVVYCARDTWEAQTSLSDGDNQGGKESASWTIRNTEPNAIVALKKCFAHHEASDGFPITTLREIHALRICSSHPNIVNLLEIAVNNSSRKSDNCGDEPEKSLMRIRKSNVFLVFEHCRFDLAQILDSYHKYERSNNRRHRVPTSPFLLSEVKTLTIQLLSALKFCHSHGLIHRDIKPSNLLYDATTGMLKVCDFGLSRIARDVYMTPNVVSLWYRAPELLLPASKGQLSTHGRSSYGRNANSDRRIRYSFPIDLWATGCIIVELLKGRPFLDGSSEIEQIEKMEKSLGLLPLRLYSVRQKQNRSKNHYDHSTVGLWDDFEHLKPEGLTFLAQLLEYNPNKRWTASEALESVFLSQISDPAPIKDLRAMPQGFPGC